MDIVYVFKQSLDNDSDELRYSLRSLRNLPHQNVYIVGEKPSWLRKAIHIPVLQSSDKQDGVHAKYSNVSNNLRMAVATAGISDNFIFMNDDFFIMKPFDAMPIYHWGPMSKVITHYEERYTEASNYINRMKELYSFLLSQGHDNPLSYELHVPMILSKANVSAMYAADFSRIYQIRTMYGNFFRVGGNRMEDVKIFLDHRHNDPAYNANPITYLDEQSLLSASGGSFKSAPVGAYVKAAFPNKSPYES